jgi:hypothetical protein
MKNEHDDSLFRLGSATGRASTRAEAEKMIEGLLATIRSLRESAHQGPEKERTIFALQSAIAGIRESMPNA